MTTKDVVAAMKAPRGASRRDDRARLAATIRWLNELRPPAERPAAAQPPRVRRAT